MNARKWHQSIACGSIQMYLHVPHFLLWYGSDAPCLLHRLAHKTEQLEPTVGVAELDTL